MQFQKIILTSIIFLSLACSPLEKEGILPIVFENKEFVDSSMFDVSIIELELTEESIIHSISQVVVFHDYVFVLDNMQSRKVLVFNKTGEFIKQIGFNGRGPGEYLHPWSLSIDKKNQHLAVLDQSQNKLILFDIPTMEFVKEKFYSFDATKAEFLSDGNIAWYGSQTNSYVLITDSVMKTLNEFLPRVFNPGITTGSSIKNLFSNDSEALFYSPFSTDIYEINNDSVAIKYAFKFGEFKSVPESDLVRFSVTNRDYIDYIKNSPSIRACDFYNTSNIVYCNFIVNKDSYLAFHIKSSQKSFYINKEELIRNLGLPKFYNPVGVYEEYLISSINNLDVLNTFESGGRLNAQIENKLRGVQEDGGFNLLLLKFID